MATGATGQLGLALPVQGELSGTWGDTVNNGITQYTNIAIAGTLTLTGDGAVTLANTTGDASASNITSTLTGAGTVTAQFAIVKVTGTLTTAKIITAPSYSKTYVVVNSATGSTVSFIRSGQTPAVSIAVGETAFVYYNGTDYVKVTGTATAGPAGGSNTQVQFNSSGVLAGSANMTFDGTILTAAGFSGPLNGTVGATTANTGAFTSLTASTTLGVTGVSTLTGGAQVTGSISGYGGGEVRLGPTTSAATSAISTQATGAPTLDFAHRGTSNTGAFNWLNGTGAANLLMTLTSTGLGIGTSSPNTKFVVSNSGAEGFEVNPTGVASGSQLVSYNRSGAAYTQLTASALRHVWQLSGSETMRIESTGNVGIGSISPQAKLVVSNAGANGYEFDPNSGLITSYNRSTSVFTAVKFRALSYIFNLNNTTDALSLDASGNLGLGVTPSAWGSSYRALQLGSISGSIAAFIGNAQTFVTSNAYNNGTNWIYTNTSGAGYYQIAGVSSGAHAWYTAPSGTAGNAITFTQAMTLDASGNLGVGVTAPTYKVDLGWTDTSIGWYLSSSYSASITLGSAARSMTLATKSADAADFMAFKTGTASTERLRIASTGAFGLSGANYGTSGQVLTSGGSGAAPTWTTVSGGGGSPATPTVQGTVYGSMTTSGASPYLTAIGYIAASSNTGGGNSAYGWGALNANTSGGDNSSVGMQSMVSNTTGSSNVAVGKQALQANTTAAANTAVGYQAATSTTTGYNNVAMGWSALKANTTGIDNIAIGSEAKELGATGNSNICIGRYAARSTTGSSNVAIGDSSLFSSNTASQLTAVGFQTLYANTSGTGNTAIGSQALSSSTTGSNNTAVGNNALNDNTTGSNLTAVGYRALFSNNNATNPNTAVGAECLYSNTSGYSNVSVGINALRQNTSGSNNVAMGRDALYYNTSGYYNVAIGDSALIGNTTASGNTAVGYQAASVNSTGIQITALGYQAAKLGTTASYITAVGYAALTKNTTGGDNVAVGASAMESNTTGGDNTSIGDAALYGNTTGAQNVGVGRSAGFNVTTGSQNICIGYATDPSAGSGSGQITIGYGLSGQGNYHVTMGTNSSKIYVNYTSTGTWTQTSDARLKNVIGQETLGLSFINRLNPVTFTWKSQTDLPVDHPHYSTANKKNTTTVMHGLLAQDVKAAMDAEGCATFNGWDQGPDGVQAVSREMFVTPLIKAIQELSAQVETLKSEIALLKGA